MSTKRVTGVSELRANTRLQTPSGNSFFWSPGSSGVLQENRNTSTRRNCCYQILRPHPLPASLPECSKRPVLKQISVQAGWDPVSGLLASLLSSFQKRVPWVFFGNITCPLIATSGGSTWPHPHPRTQPDWPNPIWYPVLQATYWQIDWRGMLHGQCVKLRTLAGTVKNWLWPLELLATILYSWWKIYQKSSQ